MRYKDYYSPKSLKEAEQLLKELDGPVTLLAGGTDIMVYAREDERYQDHHIVNIFGLPELQGIELKDDHIRIGAGATHSEIEQSPIVQKYAKILADGCRTVGSLQIRNHATLAGNICNASPAADSLAPLAVLDAKLEVLRDGNTIEIPLYDVIVKPYRTSLSDRDLVTAVTVRRLPEDEITYFYKLGRRKALAISRMTITYVAHKASDGTIDDFNITAGAIFPRPMTFPDINEKLLGKKPDEKNLEDVARALGNKIPEITGIRKSTAYKQPVCTNMAARILKENLLEV